ncbi:hypothetical protein SEA_JEMERALD_1 [Microbacterium phage Jemerald]|nr:hypothetical protein SEA_JEMERALD_1 [Microbacterium phage Jemerald]
MCKAHTTSGSPCKRPAVPGLTVCKSHGGGTAASVRASKQATVKSAAATLWGISSDTSGLSVREELEQLARNKRTDIIALRLKISGDDIKRHIGMLTETHTATEYDITGTVQSKEGTQETRSKRAGTSVWVQELHKTEVEYLAIMRLLQEVTGGNDDAQDIKRVRMQTARQAARIMKAFPGISVEDVAAEVAKSS